MSRVLALLAAIAALLAPLPAAAAAAATAAPAVNADKSGVAMRGYDAVALLHSRQAGEGIGRA